MGLMFAKKWELFGCAVLCCVVCPSGSVCWLSLSVLTAFSLVLWLCDGVFWLQRSCVAADLAVVRMCLVSLPA